MRRLLIGVCLVSLACGGDTPTQPSGPPPMPSARLEINGSLTYPAGCVGGLCLYQGELRNNGVGCASTVRGVTRLIAPDGRVISSDDWNLDASIVVRPNEAVIYRDCCLTQDAAREANRFTTQPAWTNVRC